MSLPLGDPSLASTNPLGNFHQHFRRRISTLQEQVDSLSLPGASSSDRQAAIDATMIGIARLSSELADASGDLPSYDQRSYGQAIKELQDKLAIVRTSYAPKAKFSFKNKRLGAPTSEANSATTSRSATPTHLRDPESGSRGKPTPALAPPSVHVLASGDYDHYNEDRKPTGLTTDDSLWILISAKKATYSRWPPDNAAFDEQPPLPEHGKTCLVSDISSSIVNIESDDKVPPPSALTLNTIDTTLILAQEIRGAAHITGLRNCVLVLSCHQFRMHSSQNVDVYLYCHNRPIVENCANIRFARIPTMLQRSSLGAGQQVAEAETKRNMFDQVDDFKWLRAEASPNWRVMREDEAVKDESWQEVLEVCQRLDGEEHEEMASETITRVLQNLSIKADS